MERIPFEQDAHHLRAVRFLESKAGSDTVIGTYTGCGFKSLFAFHLISDRTLDQKVRHS